MGARQYDPLSGRFLSVDPLFEQFPDKTPYHYCNNNPISFKDPSGLSPEGEKGKEDEVQVVMVNPMAEANTMLNMIQSQWQHGHILDAFLAWDRHIASFVGDKKFKDD